jgi:CheY-like chemotaxis protein
VTEKQQSQETILVVEDDILVRMPIAQYLRDCGYKVIEASNSDEAMEVLVHKETVVHIVFSDIEMPGAVDGFGLSKWVRENRPGIQVCQVVQCLVLSKVQKNCASKVRCQSLMIRRLCTITFAACLLRGRPQGNCVKPPSPQPARTGPMSPSSPPGDFGAA